MLQVLFAISNSDPGIQDLEAAYKSGLFMFHAKVGLHFSSAKSPALPTEVFGCSTVEWLWGFSNLGM